MSLDTGHCRDNLGAGPRSTPDSGRPPDRHHEEAPIASPFTPFSAALLAGAIASEIFATSSRKASQGFTRLGPSLAMVAGYAAAFYCFSLCLRTVPARISPTRAPAALDFSFLAVIFLDKRGRALHMNRREERVLVDGDGLALDGDEFRARSTASTERLKTIVAAALRGTRDGGALALGRGAGRMPLAAVVDLLPREASVLGEPRAAAAIFISDPDTPADPPAELLRHIYGLTPAEARLAVLIVRGLTLKEAARELGVRWNTVRNQLKQVLAKTGAGRQASLVRLLLTSLPRSQRLSPAWEA